MKKVDFVTIGDCNYFKTIEVSVKKIASLYPESRVVVYDWGFTVEQKKILQSINNVLVRPWKQRRLHILLAILSRSLFKRPQFLFYFLKHHRKEVLLGNKIFCFLDYLNTYGENFIFLDGDAILVGEIDEVIGGDFDIGVTLRRSSEVDLCFGNCRGLNSGVLFFLGGKNKNVNFIREWKRTMLSTLEPLIEQTSLTRLIQQNKLYLKVGQTLSVPTGAARSFVRILSCEVYNYNWIEEGFDVNQQKILHFKSGRIDSGIWDEYAKSVIQ